MTINWYALFTAIITLLCAIITSVLIPWIKTKVSNEQLAKIKTWVKVAVQAAEQLYVGTGKGLEKKNYVVNFLSDLFLSWHICITEEEINNLIESAVKELKLQEG